MKKKIIVTTLVIIFLVALCVVVALRFNPNLNKFKLKSVENNALEYIHQTYPEFTVDDISVRHEWRSIYHDGGHYVVDYNDEKGESRTIIFNHAGAKIISDKYIDYKAWDIIYDYENSIRAQVTDALKNKLSIDAYYVNIDDINVYGKDREIVLDGLDISGDSVNCSIGLTGEDNSLSLEFAKLSKEIFCTVCSLKLPIEKIRIIQHNSPYSRFEITCPVDMGTMSIEEIEKLVNVYF